MIRRGRDRHRRVCIYCGRTAAVAALGLGSAVSARNCVAVGVTPTVLQASRTAFCSLLFWPNKAPATVTVAFAMAWKSAFGLRLPVSVRYQMRPAFCHAYPPMLVAAR